MPEWLKSFEAEDSDFGGGAQVPWKCVLPLKWVPQVPRIWKRETTEKPTEADHDQSRRTPSCCRMVPCSRGVAFSAKSTVCFLASSSPLTIQLFRQEP